MQKSISYILEKLTSSKRVEQDLCQKTTVTNLPLYEKSNKSNDTITSPFLFEHANKINNSNRSKVNARLTAENNHVFIGMKGATVVYEMMRRNNVEFVFGYSGGPVLRVFDAIHKSEDIQYIVPRNEQGAGFMAEGYARASGKPGVILVTSGPGSTNLMTTLADAFSDGVPLVVFTGQVSTTVLGTDTFQEVDIIDMTKSCTKWNIMVHDVASLPDIINKAFMIAVSDRPGPVLISLPINVTESVFDIPTNTTLTYPQLSPTRTLSATHLNIKARSGLSKSVELINNSKRPVIYVGQGIFGHPDGPKVLASLSNNGNIPVTTTFHALGSFDEEDPKALHMLGTHGTCYANLAVQNADLIIALGARFDDRAIGSPQGFAPEAIRASKENRGGIIHFEILKKSINKVIQVDIVVQGDVTANLKRMLPQIKTRERSEWFKTIHQWKENYPFYYEKATEDQMLKPQQVIEEFDHQISAIKDKVIVTTGVGNHQMWVAQTIQWKIPRSFISSGGFGTMGYGLPCALGIKVAKPDHMVVDIDGDGSFSMTAMELATAAYYNLGIKVIIMNDASQGMIRQFQDCFFEGTYATSMLENPDFVKLADAMGVKAMRVSKVSKLKEKMTSFLAFDGPIVMDAIISPDEDFHPMVNPGNSLDQFVTHPFIAARNKVT